jgi:hypothetical protein
VVRTPGPSSVAILSILKINPLVFDPIIDTILIVLKSVLKRNLKLFEQKIIYKLIV